MSDLIPLSPLSIEALARSASIATATLHTPQAAALFRLSWYVEVVQTGGGTLTLELGWTDDNGAQTSNAVNAVSMGSVGYWSGNLVVYGKLAQDLTYAVTLGSPSGSPLYNLRIVLERIF